MAAFTFRTPSGIPGRYNRIHGITIEPALNSPANPVAFFGQGVILDSVNQGVRGLLQSDITSPTQLIELWGITVSPFPNQQSSASNFGAVSFDNVTPSVPQAGQIDVLRAGYIWVKVPVGATCVKGGTVYVYVGASGLATGGQAGLTFVQGGFVTNATPPTGNGTGGANSIAQVGVSANVGVGIQAPGGYKVTFNGTPDANGIVEIAFNV